MRPLAALKAFHRLCVLEGEATEDRLGVGLLRPSARLSKTRPWNTWDPNVLAGSAQSRMKAIRSGDPSVPGNEGNVELEARWYDALHNQGEPDYEVYDHPLYLAEAFACWAVYSRGYLLGLEKPQSFPSSGIAADIGTINQSGCIVDLGCGIGFSTAGLAQLFPWATVIGTNIPGTPQARLAERVAYSGRRRFEMVAGPRDITGPVRMVFASEYFEHFREPISHLGEVLDVLQPDTLLIANTFNSRSIGHFDTYRDAGKELSGSRISRAFNEKLRQSGYIKVPTKLWNNRPAYWKNARI